MKLKFLKPDVKKKKKLTRTRLYKEMLDEAIAILHLEYEEASMKTIRARIRNRVLKRLNK